MERKEIEAERKDGLRWNQRGGGGWIRLQRAPAPPPPVSYFDPDVGLSPPLWKT